MTTEEQVTTDGQAQDPNEGMGCWMMSLIAIIVIFGLIVGFLVLTGG